MSEKIEPALNAEEWAAGRVEPTSLDGWLVVRDDGDGLEFVTRAIRGGPIVDKYKIPTWDSAGIASVIALANAALPDSDPRRITRHRVALLRDIVGRSPRDHDVELVERAIADGFIAALESYLPPENTE